MRGSKVKYPEMSSQERELQSMQLDMLREYRTLAAESTRLQNLLAPYLYRASGIKPIQDDQGKIIGFEEDPQAKALSDRERSLQEKYLKRSEDALAGNLPVDPALERNLATNEQSVRERLLSQLGPGYETSTPGMQALATERSRAEELRSGARTGQLALSEQLGLARAGAAEQKQSNLMARLMSSYGTSSALGGQTAGALQGLAQALQGYGAQRQGMFQANMFNAQQPGFMSFLGQLLGIGAGSFFGGAGGAFGRRLFGPSGA
jgi:hypothetical protein